MANQKYYRLPANPGNPANGDLRQPFYTLDRREMLPQDQGGFIDNDTYYAEHPDQVRRVQYLGPPVRVPDPLIAAPPIAVAPTITGDAVIAPVAAATEPMTLFGYPLTTVLLFGALAYLIFGKK